MTGKLLFKSFHLEATSSQLLKLFSDFGEVTRLQIARDPVLLRFVGRGLLEMSDSRDAAACIEKLNGSRFMGSDISVVWAPAGVASV